MNWISMAIGIGICAAVTFLAVIFLFPDERKRRRKKDKEEQKCQKDWQAVAERRAKYIRKVKAEMERIARLLEEKEQQVAAARQQGSELKEKLKQEEGWREKEQQSFDKNARKVRQFQEELKKAEENFGKEHSLNLKLKKENAELTRDLQELKRAKTDMSARILGLESEQKKLKEQLSEEQRRNRELAKQKEDVNWVAKTDYDELQKTLEETKKKLTETQKELDRVTRDHPQ